MALADPLATAFHAAAIFENITAPIMQDTGEMIVDPVVRDDGAPGLLVHADAETLELVSRHVGPALSVVRVAAGNICVADVAVEYRPIQPVMEVR